MKNYQVLNSEELKQINGGEGILEDIWFGLSYAAHAYVDHLTEYQEKSGRYYGSY